MDPAAKGQDIFTEFEHSVRCRFVQQGFYYFFRGDRQTQNLDFAS